ncbi:MAG: sigma-54-dependent transcriptional regulator, partial [Alphaproteobacteria bacterium]
MPKRVLVVDDDPVQLRILEETIKQFGYNVDTAEGGDAAIEALKADTSGQICLVLLNLVMPGTDGMVVLSAMRSLPRKPPTIVQAAHGSIDAAISAMRAGAVDFVVKPLSPERLNVSIKNALKIGALAGEITRMKATANGDLSFANLIAGSETMKRVIELGERAAKSNIPVLIEGESGVGKELIARAIQGESARQSKPFVTLNCGAVP